MVRAADLTAFAHEQHIAVTAQARVSRPFVARKDDEATVAIVFCGEAVQLLPERRRDLEVVALVAHGVEESAIARKLDEFARRIRADGLLGLAVKVRPVRQQRRVGDDAQRIRHAHRVPGGIEHFDVQLASRVHRQSPNAMREPTATRLDARRKSRDRHVRPEAKRAVDEMARIAPLVLAFEAERERLACATHSRQDGLVEHRWSGDDSNHRLHRQLHVVVGGERIHQDLELESGLVERLHA